MAGPTGDYNQFAVERLNGLTSENCKSRVAANVNIANNGLLDEHENNISYTVRINPDDHYPGGAAYVPEPEGENNDTELEAGRVGNVPYLMHDW